MVVVVVVAVAVAVAAAAAVVTPTPSPLPPQTQSLDEGAAAISGTIVTPSNGGLVAAELRSECNGANRCATVGFGGGRGAGGGGIE